MYFEADLRQRSLVASRKAENFELSPGPSLA